MNGILDWIKIRRLSSGLKIEPIALDCTPNWKNDSDFIAHETGRFFSIVALKTQLKSSGDLIGLQPIIYQPEIGILGFVFCESPKGLQVLLQAKTEPGNIGGTQIAPTVQATYSNYKQVHKGKPTRYLSHFVKGKNIVKKGTLQSEQGTRFLGKYNRNTSVFLKDESQLSEPLEDNWKWMGLEDLLALIDVDFLINTDARSVLVCTDWKKLIKGRAPFENKEQNFSRKLLKSYLTKGLAIGLMSTLAQYRKQKEFQTELCSFKELENWVDTGSSMANLNRFSINAYHVSVNDREVDQWSQPFIQSHSNGQVILYFKEINEVLHFLVSSSLEIGFKEYVQFGPSVQILDDSSAYGNHLLIDKKDSTILCEYTQSDEGGRFFQSTVHYSLREIKKEIDSSEKKNYHWMTLKDITELLPIQGAFSNEFRSVLSLVFKFI